MALSRNQMYECFIKRCGKIQQMFNNNNVDDKQIFEELCCSVYSGDEYENVQGIIENDTNSLLDALCHIVVADYAMNSLIDSQVIDMPDHSEILAIICAQLKRNNVDICVVYNAIKMADTFNWFVTNSNELSMVYLGIREIWEKQQ